jgi:hypothetical protein
VKNECINTPYAFLRGRFCCIVDLNHQGTGKTKYKNQYPVFKAAAAEICSRL